MTVYGLGEFGG